jgi:hypothetical protein
MRAHRGRKCDQCDGTEKKALREFHVGAPRGHLDLALNIRQFKVRAPGVVYGFHWFIGARPLKALGAGGRTRPGYGDTRDHGQVTFT